ncbi:pyruvate dehydrogenase E1 component [Parafrankia irregularis]|uniref:Pyruvate dehydrogenase E1 component n=1 Tax=Parafrankia irregularis TaxID=795642 RepID=A0A0S4QEX8_9ACTN|nr:pyruvate dehydrogenase [Parafrankia sp. CH37]CUU53730.1 pyruvate dehydrogenase E1 component [Parafrankia irregularis]
MRRTDVRAGEHGYGYGGRDEVTLGAEGSPRPAGAVDDETGPRRVAVPGNGDVPGNEAAAGSGPKSGPESRPESRPGAVPGSGAATGTGALGVPGGMPGGVRETGAGGSAGAHAVDGGSVGDLARPDDPSTAAEIVPGPPGGVLDLGALAAIEERLRALTAAGIDHAVATGSRGPRGADADRAMCAAAATIATALWFDTLRVEDRVSATPHAGPLLGAVHQVLRGAAVDSTGAIVDSTGGTGSTHGAGGTAGAAPHAAPTAARKSPRATGVGNIGPNGTIWSALAGRFAGQRFDRAPHGRQICLIDFAELRDPAVWEAIADERISHLGELFWVVLVTGAPTAGIGGGDAGFAEPTAPAGGVGTPARAARMFEAAGWQVLTLRYGRRLSALFRAPGGAALRARLDAMPPGEYLSLLLLEGAELRRRLAGPGAGGVGVSRLLDALSDEEILSALRDLGGHDLPLIIDAFDEVAADRPTVLFAFTGPLPSPARPPAPRPVQDARPSWEAQHAQSSQAQDAQSSWDAQSSAPHPGEAPVGPGRELVPGPGRRPVVPLPPASPGGRLARHVAAYLDRVPPALAIPATLPVDTGRPFLGHRSTQEVFGATLRDLPALAPEAAAAVVTVSTREADHVLTGWIDATAENGEENGANRASPVLRGTTDPSGPGGAGGAGGAGGGRHVAGGLSATAFGGVLASLGVAWSRLGLPLLPIGVADEMAAPRVLPGWSTSSAGDGRSLLAVADTGVDPVRPGGWRHGLVGVEGITCWEPAFAQDLVWCLLEALGRLGRVDGASSLVRLSARVVDQRLAGLSTDPTAWWRRRAGVLAGGYRLRDGEPAAPLTLVGMGAAMPEVLRAADELSAGLRREIGVVCVTSPDLLFDALSARRGLADADDAILTELFPPGRRGPLLTVVDGDPRVLGFLAGVHGEHITTLGSARPVAYPAPSPGFPGGSPAGGRVPVDTATIVGAALDLIDEAATG